MGRRSINTTKSGKYMNPTDQARKEARKKELKKNKKQRQMVRAAVLKGKDPQQLLVDLVKIDEMEYNVLQPSPLNEKVLKDKRKKLKDTLDRVLKMYNKDDPDKWLELKRLQVEYERKRSTLFNYYESVKNAQQVQVDDIPLPISSLPPELQAAFIGMPSQIPLPSLAPPLIDALRHQQLPPAHGILKKSSAYPIKEVKREPPGVPPGPPPNLDEIDEEEEIVENTSMVAQKKSIRFADEQDAMAVDSALEELAEEQRMMEEELEKEIGREESEYEDPTITAQASEEDVNPRPSSLQQKMLALAGQDIDQFMKEMEAQHKKRRADRAAELESRLQALGDKNLDDRFLEDDYQNIGIDMVPVPGTEPLMPQLAPPGLGVLPGLPPMMFRPPPPRGVPSLMGIRLPPGPPPGLPPRLGGIRLPPGPPPGLPPRLLRPPLSMPPMAPPPALTTNVLSAAPQLISRPEPSGGPTIQAHAQIRNLSADVTRFLPTALRVKRDDKSKQRGKPSSMHEAKVEVMQPTARPGQTKDDAYQQFMREMEGLL